MIIAAANLPSKGLKIFSEEVEYTYKDAFRLCELFPGQQKTIFTIEVIDELYETNRMYNIKFLPLCMKHTEKYLSFYCYTCRKSLCTICWETGEHLTHEVIEKYDVLQDSRFLMDRIFHDIYEISGQAQGANIGDINAWKNRIQVEMFPKWIEMIKGIENNLWDLIDQYVSKCGANWSVIQKNSTELKENCIIAWDQLKKEIKVQDLIIDEHVFLILYGRMKEIEKEKDRIRLDVEQYRKIGSSLSEISNTVNSVYKELYDSIDLLQKRNIHDSISNVINRITISPIQQSEIVNRILSAVSSIKKEKKKTFMQTSIDKERYQWNGSMSMEYNLKMGALKNVSTDYIFKPWEKTKDILVYKVNTNEVIRLILEFSVFSGIKKFSPDCSWLNYNNALYICGGIQAEAPTYNTYVYDYMKESKKLKQWANSIYPHSNHSMTIDGDNIYVAGGINKQCERYNLTSGKWYQLAPMNEIQKNPTLIVQSNYLYAFFGKNSRDELTDTVQRLNLHGENQVWQFVNCKNIDCNLKMFGCAVVPMNKSTVLFVGGMDALGMRNKIIAFDFNDFSFQLADTRLDDSAYFRESELSKLRGNVYGCFSLQESNHFLKWSISPN